MGRKRAAGIMLLEGVERVKARGRTYYYWNPHRGTLRQGQRIKLPNADTHPAEHYREVERLRRPVETSYSPGSVGDLVARFRASQEFKTLAPATRANYGTHLNRFIATWGPLIACDLDAAGVTALRDLMLETAGMANHMLSCGRTLWAWGIPLGLTHHNPFAQVADLATLDKGHVPWPAWASDYACRHAPPDVARMVKLGLAVCQRESDLIRLGPGHREHGGIWCRPKKTRRKRKAFCIPLTPADAKMFDRWAETAMTFTAARWKEPIERHRVDLYLYSPRGVAYTETSLRARWHRWLHTSEGSTLCDRWQAWLRDMVAKYEWDIVPEEARYPTIHGLRGAGILIRFASGFDADQIGNDIGMSPQMVERYMRFRDQVQVAAAGIARLKLVGAGP